MNNENN